MKEEELVEAGLCPTCCQSLDATSAPVSLEGLGRMTQLAIKENNVVTNDACAVCGDRTDPTGGVDLFASDGAALVCEWKCGKEHAPSLVALLELARAAEHYASALAHKDFEILNTQNEVLRAARNYWRTMPEAVGSGFEPWGPFAEDNEK